MSIWKKAISVATSAALLASLLAATVAPAALAGVTITSAGNVPVGGTSAGTATIVLTEQSASALTNAAGSIDVCILPALPGAGSVTFSGTPTLSGPGTPGSLGASTTLSLTAGGTCVTASWTASDTANVESLTIIGLKVAAAAGTTTGAIRTNLANATGNATFAVFQGGGTASGVLATGVSIGATSATVNVTTTGCQFVNTGIDIDPGPGVTTSGKYAFAAGVAPAVAESLDGLAGPLGAPLAGQQVLNTLVPAFTSIHNAGDVVTQTNACAPTGVLAAIGTVVNTLTYSDPTPKLTVFPGENNSPAQSLVLTEPAAGFLPKDSTITYTIATAGVVFSTAPVVGDTNLLPPAPPGGDGLANPMVLSAPVLSADRKSATVTVSTASSGVLPTAGPARITLSSILYDVASTVPAGTFISVGVTTSGALSVLPASRTNAVVFRGIAASAPSPVVYIGENNQATGLITFTESAAGFFTDGTGSNNVFSICPTGVNFAFTVAPWAKVVGGVAAGNLLLREGSVSSPDNIVQGTQSGACYNWTVWTKSTTASTIQIGNADFSSGPLINVSVAQAPGGVIVGLNIGSSALDQQLAASIQFATATYRNQVAVTALSQPKIASGATNAPAGDIQIAETGIGQLKAKELICVDVLWRAGEYQDQFLNSLLTNDLPIATASGGVVIGPVTASYTRCPYEGNNGASNPAVPRGYAQSFAFEILQQSTAGTGKVVISNIKYTTLTDSAEGPVQLSVWGGNPQPPTKVDFHSTVSNAIIGAKTVLSIGAVSALGLNPTSGYTTKTPKVQVPNKYVTWKFTGGKTLANQRVNILVALRINGAWGGPQYLVSRTADANGIVTFYWKAPAGTVLNIRAQWPGNATHSVSTSPALGVHWK